MAMEQLLLPYPLLHRPSKSKPLFLLHARQCRHLRCHAASNGDSGDPTQATSEPSADTQVATPSTMTNSKPTGVKNRLRSRNQARRVQEVPAPPPEVAPKKGAAAARSQRARKEWEEMNLAEKAGELYVGEKGLLFWLNKLAYASIFVMVGGWVLFRFVGPSLGLYQLDAPPLPPTSVFTGGSP